MDEIRNARLLKRKPRKVRQRPKKKDEGPAPQSVAALLEQRRDAMEFDDEEDESSSSEWDESE